MTTIETLQSTSNQLLNTMPLWLFYILSVFLFVLAFEVGFQLSKLLQHRRPDTAETSVGALSGATLGLMAFLLAFVIGSALNIFSERRTAVVNEANAIGTTYLRAGYLPDPYGVESRELLREYVDQRIAALEPEMLLQAISRSEEIHGELWTRAETVAREQATPTISLYLASLNEMIDMHTVRLNASLVFRVPPPLVIGLYFVAIISLILVGLHAGYKEQRNIIALVAFALILSAVFLLILDLTRGQEGLLQVPQQALFDLQQQLNAGP